MLNLTDVNMSRFLIVHTGSTLCHDSDIKRTFKNSPILHEQYSNQTFDNDIALLELDTPVAYGFAVRPICLEEESFIEAEFFSGSHLRYGEVVGCGQFSKTKRNRPEALQVRSDSKTVNKDRTQKMFKC